MALKAGLQVPKVIAEYGGLDYDLRAKAFQRMADGGETERGGRGRYQFRSESLAA